MSRSLAAMPCPTLLLLAIAQGCVDCPASDEPLMVQDGNNYALESHLDIQSVALAEYADVQFDWSELRTDLQGHALDPVADVDVLSLLAFELTEDEVQQALAEDSLSQSDMALFVNLEVDDRTSASLSELGLFGNDIDVEQYFEEGSGTWLLTVNSGTTPGVGARMVLLLQPTSTSETTEVALTDDSAQLTLDVDLLNLEPAVVSGDATALSVDWSALTANAQGNALDSSSVDQVMLGRYDGLAPEDLQEFFLDLELLADELWTVDVEAGTQADLSDLPELDPSATWVLALRCTSCANPAPPFLTLLEVCP